MADKRHIVLISCVKTKQNKPAPASELYISPWFRMALAYARSRKPDLILILSAKHGVLELEQTIAPYEYTLNNADDVTRKQWANNVLTQLRSKTDLDHDEFTILAGRNYRDHLIPHIKHYLVPMQGLDFYKQLQYLSKRTFDISHTLSAVDSGSICDSIHKIARRLNRYRFPFDTSQLPSNGVYLLFEQGEYGHEDDRIVRIGAHTGQGNLPRRLVDHFITPNRDGSIFRKNIGRALLFHRKDPFLKQWNQPISSRADRDRFGAFVDREKIESVEAEVTEYITKRISFVVIPVDDKIERMALEAGLIASIAQCKQCAASSDWLGNHSPETEIRQCGLWQKQHIDGQCFVKLPLLLAKLLTSPGVEY